MNKVAHFSKVFLMAFLLEGCYPAPSVVFFGAAFPDWLLCSGLGLFGVIVIHSILVHTGQQRWLQPAVIVYPCITSLIAMLGWLLIFPY